MSGILLDYKRLYEKRCRENEEQRNEIVDLRASTSIASTPAPQKQRLYCIWTADKKLKYIGQTNEGARRFAAQISKKRSAKEVKKTANANDDKTEATAKKQPRKA